MFLITTSQVCYLFALSPSLGFDSLMNSPMHDLDQIAHHASNQNKITGRVF